MAVDNEELMQQLQRVSVLARRSHHGGERARSEEERRAHHGHHHHHDGHRASRDAVAYADPDAGHGYGNHKCHGGSGRHGQNRILALLVMREGLSQKDLAYLLGIRPQSLTEALAHLEETGLVERRHNERDARVINVFLTDAGRERAAKVAEDRKKSAADVFSVLDEDEKEQLGVILDKLTVGLEEQLSGRKPGNVGDAAE